MLTCAAVAILSLATLCSIVLLTLHLCGYTKDASHRDNNPIEAWDGAGRLSTAELKEIEQWSRIQYRDLAVCQHNYCTIHSTRGVDRIIV